MHELERVSGTYNSYTIIVNMCLLVELILEFGMLDDRPRASISPVQPPSEQRRDLLDTSRMQRGLVDRGRHHIVRVEISQRSGVVVGSSLREGLRTWTLFVRIRVGA
jgi:hypothetical protein